MTTNIHDPAKSRQTDPRRTIAAHRIAERARHLPDGQALCGLCGEYFADELSWAAHRPWKSQFQRDRCRWPGALRNRAGVWTLRPFCREAVEVAEDGEPDVFRIQWPTLTLVSNETRSSGKSALPKNHPSNYAGFSVAPFAETEGRA